MSLYQFRRFESFMWLDKDQLKLAYRYIEIKMEDYSDKFEYFYDMHMFAVKCFNNVLRDKKTLDSVLLYARVKLLIF